MLNSGCSDVQPANVQMFKCLILDVQMFSLPAAWPPATSSRVWLWRGENSLQVIIVDIVDNIIDVISYLLS